jgi:hypothetical protein
MSDAIPFRTPCLGVLCACAVWAIPLAHAEAEHPSTHKDELRRRPHGPPPEAFEACSEHKEGDDCTVALRDRTLTGSCLPALEQDALFCMPDEPPPPRPR